MKHSYTPIIPADVPTARHQEFVSNYTALTKGTDRLFLLAADHKIEHLNADFYGPTISADALDPNHLFRIASTAPIGALATHLGLIARYARNYTNINYIVKLNGKTNSLAKTKHDPLSMILWSVEDVVTFKETSQLPIRGIGLTLYIGSQHESLMIAQAAQAIYQAHQHGLVATLWGYSFNGTQAGADTAQQAAGIAGIANALGADFVKIKSLDPKYLPIAVQAAGNTRVICAGGSQVDTPLLLEQTYQQLHTGKTAGSAIGRNIFQHSLNDALAISNALSQIIYEDTSVADATKK